MAARKTLEDGLPDEIRVNWSVMERKFPRRTEPAGTGYDVKPGVYDARVVVCNPRRSTNSGEQKANIEWQFEIVHGRFTDAADPQAVGARLWRYTTFEPQALSMLDEVLYACGYEDEELEALGRQGKFQRSRCLGQLVRVSVKGDSFTPKGSTEPKYRAALTGVYRPQGGATGNGAQAPQEAAGDPFGDVPVTQQPTEEEPPF